MIYVKLLKPLSIASVEAGVWLVVIVLGSFVLPISGGIDSVLRDINQWVSAHLILLVILAVLLLCLPAVQGTLRNLLIFEKSQSYITLVLLSVTASLLVEYAGSYSIPCRPVVFFYVAIGLNVLTLIALLFRLSLRSYVPTSGVLTPDKEMDDKDQLAHEQGVIFDNLKELLLRQQQVRSIGLFGDWGTGKTSVYAIAKREMQKEDPNIIWVDIEPWRYTSQESLVLGFYEEIGKALERAIPGIQNSASDLLKIAHTLVRTNDRTGIFTALVEWLERSAGRKNDDPAKYIHQLLKREGKYLIVNVDNVERTAEDAQILRTLQLVHFLRADNVAYVFISEKDRLLNALSDMGNGKQAEYLEKFIEYELELFPPNDAQLRNFLDGLLAKSDEQIPDFQLDVPNRLIRDFKTYRGVIKIFNQFVFELDKRFLRNGHYTIKLEDKLVLDHFRLKYPLLWRHIERNRDLYDGGSRTQDTVYYFVKREEEYDQDRKKKITQAITEYVPMDKQDAARLTIVELFPLTYHLLEGRVKKSENHEEWRRKRLVCEPDVLDDYFARSQRQEAYDTSMKMVNELIQAATETEDSQVRIQLMRKFLEETKSADSPRDALRLLTGELEFQIKDQVLKSQLLRDLLRAYAKYVDFRLQEDEDGRLAPILSAIDAAANRLIHDQAKLKNFLDFMFDDIVSYSSSPAFILRMLLYMLPERENQFYGIKGWGDGFQKLRWRGLKYVDEYYLDSQDKHIFFDENRGYEWRFVLYQWAQSMRTNTAPLPIRGAKTRYKRVNEYIFDIWAADHKLAYKSIRQDIWGRHWSSDEDSWQVNSKTLAPYEVTRLVKLVKSLSRSRSLNAAQKADMKDLHKRLRSYNTTGKN